MKSDFSSYKYLFIIILIILIGTSILSLLSSMNISGPGLHIGPVYHRQPDYERPVVADIWATGQIGVSPLTIGFFDNSSGSPVSWHWDFNDGTTSDERNPVHKFYNTAEPYTVRTITLTAKKGLYASTKQMEIRILPSYPIVDFKFIPVTGTAPLTVDFTDTSSGALGSYEWHFGDGSNGFFKDGQHTYKQPGVYSVELIIDSGPGGSRSKNATIIVS